MRTLLTSAHMLTPLHAVTDAAVVMEDGHILFAGPRAEAPAPHDRHLDFGYATILPALVDVHIHGSAGHDVMEGGAAALDAIGRFLAAHGVGAYLATTVTAPLDRLLHSVDRLAGLIESGAGEGARPVGLHLEGPFISHAKCGVHPTAHILEPSLELFERLWQASRGQLKLLTIAPELPGALEVIARAVERGVRVSLGHSNATLAESRAAIAAGASSATHLFNAMRPLDHREPGLVGAALDEDIFCEFICDGIHADPLIARLVARAKPEGRLVLVTDATSAAGMPDGRYRLGDFEVDVAEGRCLYEGRLAGSVLTLDRAVSNLAAFTGMAPERALSAATANPAALLGLEGRGAIAPGNLANLTIRAPDGRIVQTFIEGRVMLG